MYRVTIRHTFLRIPCTDSPVATSELIRMALGLNGIIYLYRCIIRLILYDHLYLHLSTGNVSFQLQVSEASLAYNRYLCTQCSVYMFSLVQVFSQTI